MKKLIIVGLFLLAPKANAQSKVDLPLVGTINISSITANVGGIVAFDNHRHRWAGASIRLAWYPQDQSDAWLGLEAGALWEPATGAPSGAFASLGIRADTVVSKAHFLDRIGHLQIPSVEIGPFAAYLSTVKQWVWGAFLAKKFGG